MDIARPVWVAELAGEWVREMRESAELYGWKEEESSLERVESGKGLKSSGHNWGMVGRRIGGILPSF